MSDGFSRLLLNPLLPGTSLSPAFLAAAAALAVGAWLFILLARAIEKMQGLGLLALNRSRNLQKNDQYGLHRTANGPAAQDTIPDDEHEGSDYAYPGLLNTSTTCYLNSALQSLASCPSFVAYLSTLLASSDDLDLVVASSLYRLLQSLNTPTKKSIVLRTSEIVSSLMQSTSNTAAARNRKRIMQGSGQQDAQEFFLILAEAVEEEKKVLYEKVAEKANERAGFQELLMPAELLRTITTYTSDNELKNPFRALMAARTACMTCGYFEAIRHTATEHLTLNVPSARSCRLEAILGDYTKLELIDEYSCRRCSFYSTIERLKGQLSGNKDDSASTEKSTTSKKKRQRELQKHIQKLGEIIDAEDFERDCSDLTFKLDRAISPATKQVMYSSAPKLLVLHLSRSSFMDGGYGYSSKNNCQVVFPEYLNLDPFSTTASLDSNPSKPISSLPEDASVHSQRGHNIYRICSLVVHFGSHSYGHYVSFRRRPRSTSSQSLSDDWFRISDDNVTISSKNEMLQANPYLLFYERIEDAGSKDGHCRWRQ